MRWRGHRGTPSHRRRGIGSNGCHSAVHTWGMRETTRPVNLTFNPRCSIHSHEPSLLLMNSLRCYLLFWIGIYTYRILYVYMFCVFFKYFCLILFFLFLCYRLLPSLYCLSSIAFPSVSLKFYLILALSYLVDFSAVSQGCLRFPWWNHGQASAMMNSLTEGRCRTPLPPLPPRPISK